ncbi:hypothetical protein A6A10_02010 [Otariodibacter oris]|uniref:Uncharacterized protein n=2 Tax=Otariodibacter oris TaxID=1032623 RepID=A0A420XFW4_9PAST|nr:hypothetical protein A6A10_02010 [Otariodibacter oris]RKR71619.1 hypothetical protein DES31_1351 [Otariodibacter oris]
MQPIPEVIREFIHSQHVVSLACHYEESIWCANCFYAFDENKNRLIILTKESTQHGQLMTLNPHIAGAIAKQTEKITEIEGIQFLAETYCLTDPTEKENALEIYLQRHPIAKLIPSNVWEIQFTQIKHTSNKLAFAKKTLWHR